MDALKSLRDTVGFVQIEKIRIRSLLKNKDVDSIVKQSTFTRQLLAETLFSAISSLETLLECSEAVVKGSSSNNDLPVRSGIDKDELKTILAEMVPSLVTNVLKGVNDHSTHINCEEHSNNVVPSYSLVS